MAERVELLREAAALCTAKAKEDRARRYNKYSKLRSFAVGDKVLYRVPGLCDKLAESWEGPFEVVGKKGDVNYKIRREGSRRGEKVIHINNLIRYLERVKVSRLDVVLEEEGGEDIKQKLSGVCGNFDEEQLKKVLEEFGEVFSGGTGSTSVVNLKIDTQQEIPIAQPPYSVLLSMRDKVRDELISLEEAGIIERTDSPWASPLVPVKKANNQVRLCADFRKLNSVTVIEPYYIPGMEELICKVGEAGVLSKLDLTKGFHQVEVLEEDRPKTAFICPWGKWQYRKMPFGLCIAPAVIQKLMDIVLKDCMSFSCVYIDDILIWSPTWQQHLEDLRHVFGSLRKAGLTCRTEKCEFGKTKLQFLGHYIGNGTLSVPEDRVTAMAEYQRPRTRKQLRSFLGTINYYRKFIPRFHQQSVMHTPAISKAAPATVVWDEAMERAFCELKTSLQKIPVLGELR